MTNLFIIWMSVSGLLYAKEKGLKMNLMSAALEHTNPSMGPHEKVTTIFLDMKLVVGAQEVTQKLLDGTKVNAVMTLREYVKAEQDKNYEALKKVEERVNYKDMPTGGTLSHLYLNFEGISVKISNLGVRHLSGYYAETFQSMIITKGSKSVSSAGGPPIFAPTSPQETKKK